MKLSIVTINRNNADGLRRTLESTFAGQPGFDDWEQIVVDGASTDGSLAVLDKWNDNPHLGWHVSEPDTGLYNAMNKGAAHARGEYLLFLNSGDVLLPDSLRMVFKEPFNADLVVSNMTMNRNGIETPYFPHAPDRIDPIYFLFRTLPHQGTLISRKLHESLGGYNERFCIAADLDFFFRCFTTGTPVLKWIPSSFSMFFDDGVSNRPESRITIHKEWAAILEPYFGKDTAARAGFQLEGRRWIREDVATKAICDPELADALRRSSTVVSALWGIPPIRFSIRTIGRIASFFRRILLCLRQPFRNPSPAPKPSLPPESTP